MNYTEHRYSSKDGLSLYYREYGEGDDVIICLPGLTRNSKDFHDLATRLSASHRVLCLDLRGRGQSDRDPNWRHYHPGSYVNDTWRLMDKLAIDAFTIIGTSLGGLMSMIMASQYPQRLKAIVLNDIGPEIAPIGLARLLSYVGKLKKVENWQQAAAQCEKTYALAVPGKPTEFWDSWSRNSYRENSAGIPELDMDLNIGHAIRSSTRVALWLGKLRKWGLLKKSAGMYIDPWDSFREVSMPCLVLRGEISDILTEDIVDRMAAIKPDLVRVIIPNRGHVPLLNEPESLQAIDDFLTPLTHRPCNDEDK